MNGFLDVYSTEDEEHHNNHQPKKTGKPTLTMISNFGKSMNIRI